MTNEPETIDVTSIRTFSVIFVIGIICIFLIQYFGVIAFFSPSMLFLSLIGFGFPIYGFVIAVRGLFKKGVKTKLAQIAIGLFFCLAPFWLLGLSFKMHQHVLKNKFRENDAKLAKMCDEIMRNNPPDETIPLVKKKEFQMWPKIIGPTRQFAKHINGVVVLDFQGSPDSSAGVLYNPAHRPIPMIYHDLTGRDKPRTDNGEYPIHHWWGPWYEYGVAD